MINIVVIGGGFSGLWGAAGAARNLHFIGGDASITLVNRAPYHRIRVHRYEEDLDAIRIPLASVLDPIGVKLVIGEATSIDIIEKMVTVESSSLIQKVAYDKLIVASASHLLRPEHQGSPNILLTSSLTPRQFIIKNTILGWLKQK
nr:FAD-dependent oxidoreductase [uncultured Pseudomonas sp.]